MSICVVTDSASDIEQDELPGVRVLPMTVTIDGKPYRDGIDLDKDEFYRLLKASKAIPVSSLIAVGYSGASRSGLQKYLDGNKEIIATLPHNPDIVQIGSAVGTHAGPGAVLVTFFRKA